MEHLFICFFVEVFLRSLSHFVNCVVCFLIDELYYLYILGNSLSSDAFLSFVQSWVTYLGEKKDAINTFLL